MNQNESQVAPPGLAWRVAVSIIVFFGLLIFAIIYVAFFASSFNLVQQIAIIAVALLIGIAILGAMWASWGIKMQDQKEYELTKEVPTNRENK